MGDRNYIVPENSMSLTDRQNYRMGALAAGLDLCVTKGVGTVKDDIPGFGSVINKPKDQRIAFIRTWLAGANWPNSIDVAEFQPGTAAAPVDLVAGPVLDDWYTAPLVVIGTLYSCFQAIASPQLAQGRVAVFFGVDIPQTPFPVSRLACRLGGVGGNITSVYDLNPLATLMEPRGYFSEPFVVENNTPFAIQVKAKLATAAAAQVNLWAYTFKQTGLKTA